MKSLVIIDHGGLKATNAADPSTSGGLTTKNYVDTNFQPLDSDLTAVAGLTPSNDDLIQRKSGVWVNRSISQVMADMAFQPLDSDLTTIAGLTPTTNNIIQSVGSAWASRTPAQARTALGLAIGTDVQAFDSDLTTIAGLTAINDYFMQAKSSAWSARSIAQVVADLGVPQLLGYIAFSTSTFTTTSTSAADIGSATLTVTVGSKPIEVLLYIPGVDCSVAGDARINFNIIDVTNSNTKVGGGYVDGANTTVAVIMTHLTVAAGSRQYKAQWSINGSGTARALPTSQMPAFFRIREV